MFTRTLFYIIFVKPMVFVKWKGIWENKAFHTLSTGKKMNLKVMNIKLFTFYYRVRIVKLIN